MQAPPERADPSLNANHGFTRPLRLPQFDSHASTVVVFRKSHQPLKATIICSLSCKRRGLGAASDTHQDRLRSERLILPALPEVEPITCRLIDNDQLDSGTIAQVVSRDAVILAKLMKAANSSIFYGRSTINSLDRTVSRFGLRTTRQLVSFFRLTGPV